MLAKEHLEPAHTEMNDSLRKGLPTVKVLVANEPRLLVPYGVLFGLSLYYLGSFLCCEQAVFRLPFAGSYTRTFVNSYGLAVQAQFG
jgi:hypothetical protein